MRYKIEIVFNGLIEPITSEVGDVFLEKIKTAIAEGKNVDLKDYYIVSDRVAYMKMKELK